MPEHRAATPADLRDLESFLWHDFDNLDVWSEWTAVRGYPISSALTTFDDALELQKALRNFEVKNNGGQLAESSRVTLNSLLHKVDIKPFIDEKLGLSLKSSARGPLEQVLQLFLLAMRRGQWPRFKLCRDVACRASYYDSSKNASMTWCSMQTCGSRAKMRRFRSKAATTSE